MRDLIVRVMYALRSAQAEGIEEREGKGLVLIERECVYEQ